ncbi:uncharacterized protein LOC121404831 [Drosophila obscura]|uniref:uncharacterized protein LOC121404831 n=1 Tax=Drosophila obscura TaxID=7282 RepID=UPI001BB2AB08|nr:uncharacterized protein LOC121404831 [Drosophila obscura]
MAINSRCFPRYFIEKSGHTARHFCWRDGIKFVLCVKRLKENSKMGVKWLLYRSKAELEELCAEFLLKCDGNIVELRSRLADFVGRAEHSKANGKRLTHLKAHYGAVDNLNRKPGLLISEADCDRSLGVPGAAMDDFTGGAKLLPAAVLSEKPSFAVLSRIMIKWGNVFNGKSDALNFIKHVEECAAKYGVDTRNLSKSIVVLLAGKAEHWFWTSGIQGASWTTFRSKFLKCFSRAPLKERFRFSDERNTGLSLIGGRVYAQVLMEDHSILALLDTGSTRTIISDRVAQELCTEQNRRNVNMRIGLPDRSHLIVTQALMANVQLGGQQINLLVLVLPSSKQDAILGMDFLCRSDAKIQVGGVSLKFDSNQETLKPGLDHNRMNENKEPAPPMPRSGLKNVSAMAAPAGSYYKDDWVVAPLEWRVNTPWRRLPIELRDRLLERLQQRKGKDVRYLESASEHIFRVHINTNNKLSVHLRGGILQN